MPPQAAPPTPHQIARFGHVAAAIRAALAARGWSPADLHERLGMKRNVTLAYGWLTCRSAPGATMRPRLTKLLGLHDKDMRPRAVTSGALAALPGPSAPGAGEAMTRLQRMPMAAGAPGHRAAGGEVLGFLVGADGLARIRLDVTLPLARAAPLLRLLLDAGVAQPAPPPDAE